MNTMFDTEMNFRDRPLAFRMRPKTLEDFVGQKHIIGADQHLRRLVEAGKIFSIILYGPPGTGKTALANIIASKLEADIDRINAVNSNIKEIRESLFKAKNKLNQGKRTLLIVDEIHRFSVNQQEALLPDVEEGNITLVGLTTENPYYFVSGPLLSRARVFRFETLAQEDIIEILKNALTEKKRGIALENISIKDEVLVYISDLSGGDARYALNLLEIAATAGDTKNNTIVIDKVLIDSCVGEKKQLYDRKSEQHYDTISAFIKSIRGSDPDAAVYYLAKMLVSGEDPRFIARRLAILASEDIGNADVKAILMADACLRAVEYIGMPESRIILSQLTIYLAASPKSNTAYKAIDKAMQYIKSEDRFDIPVYLTGKGKKQYKYPHDYPNGYVKQIYKTNDVKFYEPLERGNEKYLKKYLELIETLK